MEVRKQMREWYPPQTLANEIQGLRLNLKKAPEDQREIRNFVGDAANKTLQIV